MGWEALGPMQEEIRALEPIVDAEKKHFGMRKRRRDLGQALKTLRDKLEMRFGGSFDKLSQLEDNIRDALKQEKRGESKMAREAATKFQSNVEQSAGRMLASTYTTDLEAEKGVKQTGRGVSIQQRNLLKSANKGNRAMEKAEEKYEDMDAALYRRLANNEAEATDILDENGQRNTALQQ
ncbi:hypothetical protein Pmar_PMAR016439 [Perkinsus marinus ATCC 50983]|uniref:Uncharacterized protein n=1 Tax=Perkinsus marinus (strain ATCC 50983 / TXsc) TaxID=423536 RepID=C5L1A1_PERM5|nr:hypothetical protein Pmar_PMAR016439 [Perkinsus marinus ATCC 50983]EER09508.1 hypothetical protein Pmar_PMAR016439 [Perkinsus marinus ATCC 50983]|eukprot:XP_002777692.1 hypothetical protein Pmar_PMAR016439 [Perkinsus marinus ATCC 50983]